MSNHLKQAVLFASAAGFAVSACSKKRESGVADLAIPAITAPVSDGGSALRASASVLYPAAATTGVPLSGNCTNCNQVLDMVHDMTKNFMDSGKGVDTAACYIQAMANNDVIANLTDGEYHYGNLTQQSMRFKVKATDGTLESYEMAMCQSSSQVGYVSATLSGKDLSFSMKTVVSGQGGFSINATGKFEDGSWTEKAMTFVAALSGATMKATINQYSGYLDLKGAGDVAAGGSSGDFQFYSRVQLLGSSPADFALGDGSAKASFGGSTPTVSWLGDSPASYLGSAADGEYYTAVTGGSFIDLPTDTVSYGSGETWDCQATDATDIVAAMSTNTGFATAAQACAAKYGD